MGRAGRPSQISVFGRVYVVSGALLKSAEGRQNLAANRLKSLTKSAPAWLVFCL
jgi:hypothetical protein